MKFLILFLWSFQLWSQSISDTIVMHVNKISERDIKADVWYGQDKFGYDYYVVQNEFIKSKDNERWVFKQPGLGIITKVDLQNPLRILLYYEPFNTVITLDNQLNEILTTNFNSINTIVTTAIGLSHGDRYWVYNAKNQSLGLYGYFYQQYRVFPQYIDSPMVHYRSNFNHFFWINENQEWWQSDIFGKISKVRNNINTEKVRFLNNNQLLIQIDNSVYLMTKDQIFKIIGLHEIGENLQLNNQNLLIFTEQKIITYQLKNN